MNSSLFGNGGQCDRNALTDFYGWMIQGLLAAIAFTCLIAKRFSEPIYIRRSWETWFYDTSKQGIGAFVIHMANIYLALLFQGDPCTWYIINFLLDSTIGLFIIYIGIQVCTFLSRSMKWDAINFGEYDAPRSWIYQTSIYVGLMFIVKLLTALIIQMNFWSNVKDVVLSPFANPKVKLVAVMLIIPLFVNIFIFWVTDNFLMRHKRQHGVAHKETNIFERVKIQYRALRMGKDNESESDALASDDDVILINEPHRAASKSFRLSVSA